MLLNEFVSNACVSSDCTAVFAAFAVDISRREELQVILVLMPYQAEYCVLVDHVRAIQDSVLAFGAGHQ